MGSMRSFSMLGWMFLLAACSSNESVPPGASGTMTGTLASGTTGTLAASTTGSSTGASTGAGGASSSGASTSTSTTGTGTGTGGSGGSSGGGSAADVARKLGRKTNFLIGMGNDLNNNHDMDGAYTVGTTLDLHDAYLVGGSFPWTKWNTDAQGDGAFATGLCDAAKRHGVVPMFTLYSMASRTENDPKVLTDDTFMKPYWDQAKILFQRLGAFDGPSVVHFEPDWWGFAQQAAGGDPTKLPAHIAALAPDCAGQPETLVGMGKSLVVLGRKYAPKPILGFHASRWANPD